MIEGLEEVLRRLQSELDKIEGKTQDGLLKAGLKVQRLAQQRVPVEYGVLKRSAYTVAVGTKEIEVGFTAPYALFVHENMEQKLKGKPRPSGLGVYWGPAGQPKFLESAFHDLEDEVLETVAREAEV